MVLAGTDGESWAAAGENAGVWLGVNRIYVEFKPSPATGGAGSGLRLDLVVPGSPADEGGLREGDILLTLDNKPLASNDALTAALAAAGLRMVPVTLLRDGRPLAVNLRLASRPADMDARFVQALRARAQSENDDAAAAIASRDYRSAFDHEVKALRYISAGTGGGVYTNADYDAALARLAQSLPQIQPPPSVSSDAERWSRDAISILQSAKDDEDNDRATEKFAGAVYEAPWVADLYFDEGLVLAKAGRAILAAEILHRYLILDPAAKDAAALKQRIADLEQIGAEQKPWLPFLGQMPMQNGDIEMATLRNRDFTIKVVSATPKSNLDPGDLVCVGTIHGSQFQGSCNYAMKDPDFVACFGRLKRYDADGEIEGNILTIRSVHHLRYFSDVCAVTVEDRGTFRTIRGRQ